MPAWAMAPASIKSDASHRSPQHQGSPAQAQLHTELLRLPFYVHISGLIGIWYSAFYFELTVSLTFQFIQYWDARYRGDRQQPRRKESIEQDLTKGNLYYPPAISDKGGSTIRTPLQQIRQVGNRLLVSVM